MFPLSSFAGADVDISIYYIVNFYSKRNIVPRELIVPELLDNELLSEIINTKVINVFRGPKKKLFDMAYNNAKTQYEKEIQLIYNNEKLTTDANDELKSLLNMPSLHTIEAFDNSNLFGTYTVSGMVVFKDGMPSKKDYRKVKLTFDKNDDIAAMKEVIYRRYFRLLNEHLPLPELIVVDGGYNQITATKEVISSLYLDIKVIGVKKDSHHSPTAIVDGDNLTEIAINKNSNVFRLLSRIDEEVHRFTINYHRDIRSKGSISSLLDNIPGIGSKRKKELIKKYGSINKIKDASVYELSKIVPLKVAEDLKTYLNEENEK